MCEVSLVDGTRECHDIGKIHEKSRGLRDFRIHSRKSKNYRNKTTSQKTKCKIFRRCNELKDALFPVVSTPFVE